MSVPAPLTSLYQHHLEATSDLEVRGLQAILQTPSFASQGKAKGGWSLRRSNDGKYGT